MTPQMSNVEKLIADRKEQDRLSGIAFETDYEARIIIDLDGMILVANRRARLVTAHPDLVGKNFRILIPKRFAAIHDSHFEMFVGDPRTRPMGVGRELFMLDGRDVEKRVELSLNPLEDPDGGSMKICVGIVVPQQRATLATPATEPH